MRKSLTKAERLRSPRDIDRIFKEGQKARCDGMQLRYLPNDEPHNRVLLALIRKYGNAVERNRAKRVARESYRAIKHRIRKQYDLVFILYRDIDELPTRMKQMCSVLTRVGLLLDERNG